MRDVVSLNNNNKNNTISNTGSQTGYREAKRASAALDAARAAETEKTPKAGKTTDAKRSANAQLPPESAKQPTTDATTFNTMVATAKTEANANAQPNPNQFSTSTGEANPDTLVNNSGRSMLLDTMLDTWNTVSDAAAPVIRNTARKADQVLEEYLTKEILPFRFPVNLGGTGNTSFTGGIGSSNGHWDSMGIKLNAEIDPGNDKAPRANIWGRSYELKPVESLSTGYFSDLGVPTEGTVNKVEIQWKNHSLNKVFLTPIDHKERGGGKQLTRGHFFFGAGVKVPKKSVIGKTINRFLFNGQFAQGQTTSGKNTEAVFKGNWSTNMTFWGGFGTNIERIPNSNGGTDVTQVEFLATKSFFFQSTANPYFGVEHSPTSTTTGPSKAGKSSNFSLTAGPGGGIFSSSRGSVGLKLGYTRQLDTRNGGNSEIAGQVSEAFKNDYGVDGVLSLLQNEASNGVRLQTHGDPVREQLLKVARTLGVNLARTPDTDPHLSERFNYEMLSARVNRAIDAGREPEDFAGAGGLSFGNRKIRDINEKEYKQATMYVNTERLEKAASLPRLPEGKELKNDEKGNLLVKYRQGNKIVTDYADGADQNPFRPPLPPPRELNRFEVGASWTRDQLGSLAQKGLNGLANGIEGTHNVIRSLNLTSARETLGNLREKAGNLWERTRNWWGGSRK